MAGEAQTAQEKLGGVLKELTNRKLEEVIFRGLLERTHFDLKAVDDVILGCGGSNRMPIMCRVS